MLINKLNIMEQNEFQVFAKLQELQTLIKKESSLKQLCKVNKIKLIYYSSQYKKRYFKSDKRRMQKFI
jgi:predicted GIY-YIG superfamily endonuclease